MEPKESTCSISASLPVGANRARDCADAWGTAGLLACLAAGSFYQQPPMRARPGKADKEPPAGYAAPELTNPLLGKSPV